MSDTPITDALIATNATAIFDHARAQERRLTNLLSIIARMTDEQDSLTDEDILGICQSHNPEAVAKWAKMLIGLYHRQKSEIAALRMRLEMGAAKHG